MCYNEPPVSLLQVFTIMSANFTMVKRQNACCLILSIMFGVCHTSCTHPTHATGEEFKVVESDISANIWQHPADYLALTPNGRLNIVSKWFVCFLAACVLSG